MSCLLCNNLIQATQEFTEHDCDAMVSLMSDTDIINDRNVYRVGWISLERDIDGEYIFNSESFFDREGLARKFYAALKDILKEYRAEKANQ
jgi:hypothetical protein